MFENADGTPGYELTRGRMRWSLRRGDKIYRVGGQMVVDASTDGFWRRW